MAINRAKGSTYEANIRGYCESALKYLKKLWRSFCGFWKRVHIWNKSNKWKRLWRGLPDETEKIVLRRSIWSAALHCWTHVITLLATGVLAYLNFAGYFIGALLRGNSSTNYQSFYQLCLQVVAKFLELLIVASLGTILIDVLSTELLFGSNGLPLGLLSSKQRFPEVQYLFSPEFRFGLSGFPWRRRWRTRLAIGLLIVASFFISILAGPSVAVLVIPSARTDWPGGGASLWLWGDDDSLWPARLTNAHIGPSHCVSPDADALIYLASAEPDLIDCLWSGFFPILEFFKQSHFEPLMNSLNYHDHILRRDLNIFPSKRVGSIEPAFASTVHLATGVVLANAGRLWYTALGVIPEKSRYRTLLYRDKGKSTGYAHSWFPAVRTSCNIMNNDSDTLSLQKYPFVIQYNSTDDLSLLIPNNFSFVSNATMIRTQWVDVPPSVPFNNGSNITYLPSALINVALPNIANTSAGYFLTCSVEARWAMGRYRGGPINSNPTSYVQAIDMQTPDPFEGSRHVRMDIDWLQSLTPAPPNDSSTMTTLAAILSFMDFRSLINEGSELGLSGEDVPRLVSILVQSLISTVVTDGMSRVGFADLLQAAVPSYGSWLNVLPAESPFSIYGSFMAGKYKFPRPSGTSRFTRLDWTVQVTGLAYRADGNAYKFAFAVLFLHAALALAHTAYILYNILQVKFTKAPPYTRVFCNTWDSFLSLVVLATKSGVEHHDSNFRAAGIVNGAGNVVGGSRNTNALFKNAGTGIKRYRTMKTEVRIRSKNIHAVNGPAANTVGSGGGGEQVEVLFGRDEATLVRDGFGKLELGKAYG